MAILYNKFNEQNTIANIFREKFKDSIQCI